MKKQPEFPLTRIIKEGVGVFCPKCDSTMSKRKFFGLIGKRYCDQPKCKNSKQ